MSITRKSALLGSLLLACIVSYLGAQSNLVRIAYLSLGHERTLDNYSQIDTTVTDVSATADPAASSAVLLSAFFGLDDALPLMASRVICEGAAGKDGMPVVFSHELNVQTVQPGDFKITAASGSVGKVTCLTLARRRPGRAAHSTADWPTWKHPLPARNGGNPVLPRQL